MERSRLKERESLIWGKNENSSLWLEKGRRELQRQEKKEVNKVKEINAR